MDNLNKIMNASMSLIECSKKNCIEHKKKLMANKELYEKYMAYNKETDKTKKIQLLNELYKHNIMFEYNKCILKNCKKMFKDLMQITATIFENIPKTDPNYTKLNKIFEHYKKLINKPNLTIKDYNLLQKYMIELSNIN